MTTMNDPRNYELECPNPNCSEGFKNRHLYLQAFPFERIEYVQVDLTGSVIASVVVYRCRRCGHEFTAGDRMR